MTIKSRFVECFSHDDKWTKRQCFPDEKETTSTASERLSSADDDDDAPPVSMVRFCLIMSSLLLLPFLYSLDMLMLATAMPVIVDAFNALDKVAWLSNSFFASMFGFNLAFAQWLQLFPAKHVAIFAVCMQELGCAVAGSARSINVLFVGRAISGIGAAGLYNVAVMMITELCHLELRAKMLSLLGFAFAIASILGPIIGGSLTDRVSWRWCFYINIPIGLFAIILLCLLVRTRAPWGYEKEFTGYNKALLKRFGRCDWVGLAFCLVWVLALITALGDGGNKMAWNHPLEITLLVLLFVLPVCFFFWERFIGERALMHVDLMRYRTMIACCTVGVCVFSNSIIVLYFLSELFRAVYDLNGTKVSLYLFPYVVSNPFSLFGAAFILVRFRCGMPILFTGAICAAVPTVILAVFTAQGNHPLYATCILSVFVSLGIGAVSQTTLNMAQMEFRHSPKLLSNACGITIFANNMGRVLGPAVGSSVFRNRLKINLQLYAPTLEEETRMAVFHRSTAIYDRVAKELQPHVIKAYSLALSDVFYAASVFGFVALAGSLVAKYKRFD